MSILQPPSCVAKHIAKSEQKRIKSELASEPSLRRDIVAAMKLAVFAVALPVLHPPASAQPEAEPIRLNPTNPHYFLYQGKAIALVTSGEHYGSVINADFDFHKYL